jgi:hypothetical protein
MPGSIRVGRMLAYWSKPLADLQSQAPQRDVVGDVGIARGTEEDRVHVADLCKSILRHHQLVQAVVVAAPVEGSEVEVEPVGTAARRRRHRFKHRLPRGDDFLADAVARDAGHAVGPAAHLISPASFASCR